MTKQTAISLLMNNDRNALFMYYNSIEEFFADMEIKKQIRD